LQLDSVCIECLCEITERLAEKWKVRGSVKRKEEKGCCRTGVSNSIYLGALEAVPVYGRATEGIP